MAQLTLSFKGRKIRLFAVAADDCVIGRDPRCTICIDSLAVAPRHARIRSESDCYYIEALDAAYPLSVDQQHVTEARMLDHGDTIQVGKHSLSFSGDDEPGADAEQPLPEATVIRLPPVGWLQIQNGPHLGRTIRLNKAFTRIGKPGVGLAVIAHRDDGYYVSALHGPQGPQLNSRDIGENSCRLDTEDLIAIGRLQLQFFCDAPPLPASPTSAGERRQTGQRRFSRVPFEVDVTLQAEQQSWNSRLVDISLLGALIRLPEAFPVIADQRYRLAVHLQGGSDIRMEVEIAHRQDGELGLACKHIDGDSITQLRRLVELNRGDPALLERELTALG